MKAIVVRQPGGPEELFWDEVPRPEPGPGEVRIAVAAAGVNRADLLQRRGFYPPPPDVTDILGLEVAGTIDAIGPMSASHPTGQSPVDPTPHLTGQSPVAPTPHPAAVGQSPVAPTPHPAVVGQSPVGPAPHPTGQSPVDPTQHPTPHSVGQSSVGPTPHPAGQSPVGPTPHPAYPASLRVGDSVVALLAGGGYAEYVTVPLGQCAPIPAAMGMAQAGGVMETAATVVSNFDHIGLRSGETVLIHGGAGGIGSFAIPYAKHLGCTVITTVGGPDKADQAKRIGADHVIDYHDDWAAAVRQVTDSRGVDVILDIIGAKYLEANVAALARGGRMTVIGLQGGTKATLDLNRLLTKGATVTATSLRFRPTAEKAAIVQRVATDVWPLFESGAIPLPPLTTFPLAEAASAHRLLESGHNIGKIVLTLN